MSALRELVLDCINKKEHSFDPKNKVTVLGLKYFIVLDNDEIDVSEHESILDRPNIKYSFTFIKVRYSPKIKYYASYLAPIIVSHDLKVSHGQLALGNWVVNFKGQSLEKKPSSLKFKIVDHKNRKLTSDYYSIEPESLFMNFENAYNLWMAIGECTSNDSAQLVVNHFKKEDAINKKELFDDLLDEISELVTNFYAKDPIINKYEKGSDQ